MGLQLLAQWNIHSNNTRSLFTTVKFSPDAAKLATISNTDIFIYDLNATNTELCTSMTTPPSYQILSTNHVAPISELVWSPDGKCIATASDDYTINITHLQWGHLFTLVGHTMSVINLIYKNKGNLLYSCSVDESIKVWDVLNGKLLKTISAHSELVNSISLPMGDNSILCSGSLDGLIRIFDSVTGFCLKTLTYDKDWNFENRVVQINKVVCSFNGKFLLVKSWDGFVKIWDIVNGIVVKTFKPVDVNLQDKHSNEEDTKKYLGDCNFIYTDKVTYLVNGDNRGNVFLYNTDNPSEVLQELQVDENSPVMCIDTTKDNSNDNSKIATVSLQGKISLWCLQQEAES